MPLDSSRVHEDAPHSRLFIIASKTLNEDDFRKKFQTFGKIEDIFIVKDRNTGDNKGVVYIKFSKTSEAAKALEAMHGEVLGGKPLRVRIASRPEEGNREIDEEELSHRLFVVVPKNMTDDELYDAFKDFGTIDYARIIRDRNTRESKGVAYVKFKKFSEAANAFENCDRSFKAVFAKPKKSAEEDHRGFNEDHSKRFPAKRGYSEAFENDFPPPPERFRDGGYHKLFATASSMLNQDQIWKLFDLIPTMDFCDVFNDGDRARVEVIYKSSQWATYAKQKLHGFEFPPGHRLIVKSEFEAGHRGPPEIDDNREEILKIAETLVQATSQIKRGRGNVDIAEILQPLLGRGGGGVASSSSSRGPPDWRDPPSKLDNFDLPKRKPLVEGGETKARCFVVCQPKALPVNVLRDLFCRFGGLIDVYLVRGKNFGYAMFTSELCANNAMQALHGFECLGVTLKVVEAEDKKHSNKKSKVEQDFY